jgi:hypothetical protein
MPRTHLLLAVLLALPLVAAAQTPPAPQPTIDINVSGQSGAPGSGVGTATVSGQVNLPPGWKLSIHTLTLRYKKAGTATTLNAFLPVKGAPHTFKTSLQLANGSYQVWGVIDVKDPSGKTKEISSPPQSVPIQ